MPDETKKAVKKPRKGNPAVAAATRAARANEVIEVLEGTFNPPARTRGRYPWASLTEVGKAFLIAGATKKRQLAAPEGVKIAQEVCSDGLRVIRVA